MIFRSFYVVPFYELKVIRTAHELKGVLGDYIDPDYCGFGGGFERGLINRR